MRVIGPSCQKVKDIPDEALVAKRPHFQLRCAVRAEAIRTSMIVVQVRLQQCPQNFFQWPHIVVVIPTLHCC